MKFKLFSNGDISNEFWSPDKDYIVVGGGIDLAMLARISDVYNRRLI